MSVVDLYVEIQTDEKSRLFDELRELKEQRKKIDKTIKELEKGYKPMLDGLQNDLFFITKSGSKFSIKRSVKRGSIDTDKLKDYGINPDDFRKSSITVNTLRFE